MKASVKGKFGKEKDWIELDVEKMQNNFLYLDT